MNSPVRSVEHAGRERWTRGWRLVRRGRQGVVVVVMVVVGVVVVVSPVVVVVVVDVGVVVVVLGAVVVVVVVSVFEVGLALPDTQESMKNSRIWAAHSVETPPLLVSAG